MTTVLASKALAQETTFSLTDAIARARKQMGIGIYGMNELIPGKLYSPTRPVQMKNTILDAQGNGQAVNILPDMVLQYHRTIGEGKDKTMEFLGDSNLYTLLESAAFDEMEPLFFIRSEELELNAEFSIFDTYGVDLVAKTIQERFDNKSFPDRQTVKNGYAGVVKEILDPLIDQNLLVEYKLLDESDNLVVLQVKTTPKGAYCRVELGL